MTPGPGVGEGACEEGQENIKQADGCVFIATDDETLIKMFAVCGKNIFTFE